MATSQNTSTENGHPDPILGSCFTLGPGIYQKNRRIIFIRSVIEKNKLICEPCCSKQNQRTNPNFHDDVKKLQEVKNENLVVYKFGIELIDKGKLQYNVVELCVTSLENWILINKDSVDILEGSLTNEDPRSNLQIKPLDILKQACMGLAYLHSFKPFIIHRHIKPSNILLTKSGNRVVVKLSDVEVNKKIWNTFLSRKEGIKDEDSPYMPKEYFLSKHLMKKKPTKKADVFSMGVVFYYVLTNGGYPFLFAEDGSREDTPHLEKLDSSNEKRQTGLKEAQWAESRHIIRDMIQHEVTCRPTIGKVLEHPLFWNSKMRKDYLVDVHKDHVEHFIKDGKFPDDKPINKKYNQQLLQHCKNEEEAFNISPSNLPKCVRTASYRPFKSCRNVGEFLHVFRNHALHNLSNYQKQELFDNMEGDEKWDKFLECFLDGIEHLVVHLYGSFPVKNKLKNKYY